MEHKHSSNCGCKEYINVENADDLFSVIDLGGVMCLNESRHGSGRTILKEESKKLEGTDFVNSDDPDPEVIFIIPFTCEVKLKTINIIAQDSSAAANKMKVYINVENVDFSITNSPPTEEFRLVPNLDGSLHSSVRQSKFQNVSKLILHIFSDNPSIETIGLSYIGLRGHASKIKRQIVEAMYELKPLVEDKNAEDIVSQSAHQSF